MGVPMPCDGEAAQMRKDMKELNVEQEHYLLNHHEGLLHVWRDQPRSSVLKEMGDVQF